MSKKAKAAAKIKRLSFKRARKEAQTKQYQTWAAAGQNQLSRRSKLAAKKGNTGVTTRRHGGLRCDNIGCQKCHTELNGSTYASPGSFFYGRKFSRETATWVTSKEKLTHSLKIQEQERTNAKAVRQGRNAKAAAEAAELAETVAKSEVLWAKWASDRKQARAEAKAQLEAEQAEELAQTVPQET
jgi:hypothetical protein